MIKKLLLFLFLAKSVCFADVYRKSFAQSFAQKATPTSLLWVNSSQEIQNYLLSDKALPAVICITHSSLPLANQLNTTLEQCKSRLKDSAKFFAVDLKNEALAPFVIQIKQQIGLAHIPLPCFIFFNKTNIVLPIQAGLCTPELLESMTLKRFKKLSLSLEKK